MMIPPKTQSENSGVPGGSGVTVLVAPPPTLRQMLVGLFLYPHMALLAARASSNWRRALLLVVLVGVVAGGVLGMGRLPRMFRRSGDWAEWFGSTVGAMWVEKGRVHWEQPARVPFETRRDGWQVAFAEPDRPFSSDELKGPETRGVWLSAVQVVVWWLNANGDVSHLTLLDGLTDRPQVDLMLVWPKSGRLEGSDFRPFTVSLLRTLIPVMLLTEMAMLIVPVLFYTLLFTMTSLLLRGGRVTGGFRSTLSVNLFASVPPMIVAAVYSGLHLPYLDFHMVFITAFFVYLLMAFARIRAQSEDHEA